MTWWRASAKVRLAFAEALARSTMTIAIHEALQEFVDAQVAKGRFDSAEGYVAGLICQDMEREARGLPTLCDDVPGDVMEDLGMTQEEFEAEVQKGIDSGPATPMTREDWESIRREGLARLAARAVR